MTLYATVASERASKGQGGNEYLDIEVQDKRNAIVLMMRIEEVKNNPTVTFYEAGDINTSKIVDYELKSKGEKQKTANVCSTKNCKNDAQSDDPKCPAHAELANMGIY